MSVPIFSAGPNVCRTVHLSCSLDPTCRLSVWPFRILSPSCLSGCLSSVAHPSASGRSGHRQRDIPKQVSSPEPPKAMDHCGGLLKRNRIKNHFSLEYSLCVILPCEGCLSALAPASPWTGGRDFGLELWFRCSVPPKGAGREQPWGCWKWCWGDGMASVTTAR